MVIRVSEESAGVAIVYIVEDRDEEFTCRSCRCFVTELNETGERDRRERGNPREKTTRRRVMKEFPIKSAGSLWIARLGVAL
jgi:predicted metal-binding protein